MKIKTIFLFLFIFAVNADAFKHYSIFDFLEEIEVSENKRVFIDDYLSFLENNDEVNAINSLNSSQYLYKKYVFSKRSAWRGVPIFIKDNIDSVNLPNTAGSIILEDNIPRDNAHIVTKLEKDGFLVVGKTNLSEWANFRGQNSISGWSSFGGQTLNPYNLEYNPCGSSSGSAAIVAEGLAPVSIGTETNGSIACPASVNGVVGIKPTVGLVSRDGIIPISSSQDTAGPMAKSVIEAAIVLHAISGKDPKDPATFNIPANYNYDSLVEFDRNYFIGKRIGVIQLPENASEAQIKLDSLIREIILKSGGTIVDVNLPSLSQDDWANALFLLYYEFNLGLNNYLKQSSSKVRTISDVIEANTKNKEVVLKHFDQELMVESSKTSKGDIYNGEKSEKTYQDARNITQKAKDIFDSVLADYSVELLVGLTRNPAWKINYNTGDNFTNSWGNGSLSAIAGYPHVTIPLSFIDGFPVGVSFMASSWEEAKVINAAFAFEQANNFSPRPLRDKN